MYCDLSIINRDEDQTSLHQLLVSAICDGYSLISINYVSTISLLKFNSASKNVVNTNTIDGELIKQIYAKYSIQFLNCQNLSCIDWNKVRVYKRLTLQISEQKDLYYLTNQTDSMKSYDVLAVKPMNDKMLELCLNGEINCDIVVINLDEKLNLVSKKHLLLSSAGNNIFFEVEYAAFVSNNESRSNFISNFLLLFDILKGANIIISSGASTFFQHRSPFDLMTIFETLFSIKTNIIKQMLSENAEKVILKSIQRKLYKNTLDIQINKSNMIDR